jgi:hypothetical protein
MVVPFLSLFITRFAVMQSPKATILRGIVQKQFRDNKDEANQEKLHKMKQAYVLRSADRSSCSSACVICAALVRQR